MAGIIINEPGVDQCNAMLSGIKINDGYSSYLHILWVVESPVGLRGQHDLLLPLHLSDLFLVVNDRW